jgi:hypothetical protein
MYKILILFCIFANFWGCYLAIELNLLPDASYIVPPNRYYHDTIIELLIVSIVLITYAFTRNRINRSNVTFNVTHKHKRFITYLYLFFVISSFAAINFSGDNSARGVDQFELSGRGGIAGLFTSVQMFYVPFFMFLLMTKPFKEKNNIYVMIFLLVFLVSGITGGGRRNLAYLGISLLLFFYYYKNLSLKKVFLFSLPLIFLFPISLAMRNEEALLLVLKNADPVALISSAFILTNSDPSFMWAVKDYMASGISLSPFTFMMHFVSLLVPSFVFIILFNKISYERSVFLFDNLFNNNPNQGYDFMLLADFFWCFGYFGYVLYVLLIMWCMKFFKRNVYSLRFYKITGALLSVIFICQQRNDFGAILKSFVYCFLFAYLLDRFFIKKFEIVKDQDN